MDTNTQVIETTVLLTGAREAIIRILNRAFSMVASGEYRIADDDSVETINAKITAANKYDERFPTGFTLMDYLDVISRINSPFKDYILSYIDEEEPDGSENYDANPVEVTEEGGEYTLKIVSRVREGQRTYYPEDWHYWCGMVSVRDACLIRFNKEQLL